MQRWHIGSDRYGRRVFLMKEGHDYTIDIEPSSQRDDGEKIRSLSRDLLVEAARVAAEAGQ